MTMSVARPLDRRPPLGAEAAPASAWLLPGSWRERRDPGRHRPAARRRVSFLQVVAGIILGVRTMVTAVGNWVGTHGWSVAWPAAFVAAGFTRGVTTGLVVLGFACLWMELRTTK